jgi:hypothetical protein
MMDKFLVCRVCPFALEASNTLGFIWHFGIHIIAEVNLSKTMPQRIWTTFCQFLTGKSYFWQKI